MNLQALNQTSFFAVNQGTKSIGIVVCAHWWGKVNIPFFLQYRLSSQQNHNTRTVIVIYMSCEQVIFFRTVHHCRAPDISRHELFVLYLFFLPALTKGQMRLDLSTFIPHVNIKAKLKRYHYIFMYGNVLLQSRKFNTKQIYHSYTSPPAIKAHWHL